MSLRFSVYFTILVTLTSFVVSVEQYGKTKRNLYVNEDTAKSGGSLTIINRNLENENPTPERAAIDTTTLQTVPAPGNISTWTTHLNDSHQQLMVWVGEGSGVIICLARDSTPTNDTGLSPSALYISYDSGKNFLDKTEHFRLGGTPDSGYAQVDKFFNHPNYPEHCVFADSTNKKLYYTSDSGRNIYRSDLPFSPSELVFDEEYPDKYVILDKIDNNRTLYLTIDGGKTFEVIQSYVRTFFWSSGSESSKAFYVERWNPDGTSTVFNASNPTELINADVLFEGARDFQIIGDYMFATKQSKERDTLHLYISYQRGPFVKAKFQTELDLRKFHIADVTERRIFVSVMHTESLANLYVSEIGRNATQYDFVLSLKQIFCYFPDENWRESWLKDVTEDSFTNLYRVEGLKGIYIASQVDSKVPVANIGPEHLVSLITFDHGVTWAPIKPLAEDENGKPLNCDIENSCSLHLYQKFSQLYPETRSVSILSSKSAPGIIMATGVMGKSLKGIPGVYMSRDAGLTWKRILKDFYLFNYGDHGGVLVVVKYFKSRGETRRILYSTNEGVEWHSYQFNADGQRIYGLITEPGENTTTFTMIGSANDKRQWNIITMDLKNTFARNCTQGDYEFWSPSSPNTSVLCILGSRDLFQRRLDHTDCYNGIDYQRQIKKEACECTRRDYECDLGFMLSGEECIQNQSAKYDPYAVPSDCPPGQYYTLTKGYRKIDGNMCTLSGYSSHAPEMIPCPTEELAEFMLVAMKDKIARIDLSTNITTYPIENQRNVITMDFDVKNNCIYWADSELGKISRQCFNNGSQEEIIVNTDLASIEGMALDWISNVLLFVNSGRKKIEAVKMDFTDKRKMRVTILDKKVLSKPRGIAVHPKAGYLFWTDWNVTDPSVSRSNLDGTNVKKLFGKSIVYWPNGITVDQMSEKIYWVDAKEDYIASSDLNGRSLRRILWNDDKVSHPFGVAVLRDKMYWDDWKVKSIFMADKVTGMNVVTINDSLPGLMDLKVFAHSVQYGSNLCSFKNTSCEGICLGKPENNSFSCLCPDGLKNVNGSCLCLDGTKPSANMTCPKTSETLCGPEYFACKHNNTCIPTSWRCDGKADCGDNSDEMECLCSPPMISCDITRCYVPQWKCDGKFDCADKSDEKDCGSRNCTENEFQCDNGNCIVSLWVCDGDADCQDKSDERNCRSQAERADVVNCTGKFLCGNDTNACIPNTWVCDDDKDCPNGSDEAEELCKSPTCAPYMFRCPNGKCIFKNWVCDGENDCNDREASDEKNCTKLPTKRPTFPNNTCWSWLWPCNNGRCVPDWWRCDGVDDCEDNSDEVSCEVVVPETKPINSSYSKCEKYQFTCAPGNCVPLAWACDGSADCIDGVDERDCMPKPSPGFTCAAEETPCADRKSCVKSTQLCDGFSQCDDGSDETNCPMAPVLSIGVDQSSTNSTSFLILLGMVQRKMIDYSFLPSISKVSGGEWLNISWINDNTYRFIDLEPNTNYNVTFYIKDNKFNKTYASDKYVSTSTGEGVPTPPRELTIKQVAGSKIQVLWDQPENPRGVIQYYELYFSPPTPPIMKIIPANNTNDQSIPLEGVLVLNTNYSFWMKAVNNAYTSNSSEVLCLMFDEGGDIDDLTNVSMSRPNASAVYLEWNKIRGVDGYSLKQRLPVEYAQRPLLNTKANNITITDLPPGVRMYIDIQAYKNSLYGDPFTVPLTTDGQPDETLNLTAILLKEKQTSVQLIWSPPIGERYKNKELQYEVHYTNMIRRTNPGEMSNDTRIITKETSIVVEDLHACESYMFSVGLLGGPLSKFVEIITRENIKAPVKDLRVEYIEKTADMKITWIANCDALRKPVTYMLEITEETHDKKSQYELLPSAAPTFKHIIHNVPDGGRYNVCISAAVEGAALRCVRVRSRAIKSPVGVAAWLGPHGHLMVTWQDYRTSRDPVTYKHRFQVLVSDKEIPEETLHPSEAMKTAVADASPLVLTVPAERTRPLYVSVRALDENGYYSDLREVQTLHMEDEVESEPASALAAVWWGAGGALVAAVVVGAVLVHVAVRHRRLARSFMRFTSHTPRYDTRRGQATITDHDDDDVPPIHGFSDDEPLVIA